jgi:hypothetical protein
MVVMRDVVLMQIVERSEQGWYCFGPVSETACFFIIIITS